MSSAVVLAGGRSRRMGTDKALLEFGGVTLIERSLRRLAGRFDALHVSVGQGGAAEGVRTAIERFQQEADRRVEIIADRLEGAGPIAGIHAALEAIEGDRAFFVAVDVPCISFALVELLWEGSQEDGCLGCLPSLAGRLQPVFAVYCRALAEQIPAQVEAGRRSLQDLRRLERVRVVDLDDPGPRDRVLASENDSGADVARLQDLFRNINTPEDYRAWVEEEGISG